MSEYAPLTKDIVCQHQTLSPGMGIELGMGMAIGFAPIPLHIRYESFRKRLDSVLSKSKA